MGTRPTPEALAVAAAFRHLNVDVDVDGDTIQIGPSDDLIVVRTDEPDATIGGRQIVVRDRVTRATARRLQSAGVGWLDLSGHLSYRSPGVVIDADVPGLASQQHQRRAAVLGGPVVAGVTIAALAAWPEPLQGVRATARELGATAAGVSIALRRLIDAGYVTADKRATPALFWTAADEWRPDWVELPVSATPPGTKDVAAVGALAAARLGAPVAVTAGTPPEYLVASGAQLKYAQLAARTDAGIEDGTSRARYAIAPAPNAVHLLSSERVDIGAFPVASEAVVALSIALDSSRGAETVREWRGVHVWN